MPSPPITATRREVAASGVEAVVMSGRLVVVGPLAAVVPQVERRLQRLVAVGVLGLVVGGTPAVGVHVVHGTAPCFDVGGTWTTSRLVAEPAHPVVGLTNEIK